MAKTIAAASLCLVALIASLGPARAQTPGPQNLPTAPPCGGVLCSLTPTAMDRPISADDAKRMEAERASQTPDASVATLPGKRQRHRRVASETHRAQAQGRSVAARIQASRRRHADAKTPVAIEAAARPGDNETPTKGGPIDPINAIFVLAPRPFDPYGGDYGPWLDRLAWPSRPDRGDDRTVFTPDGYAEAARDQEAAPVSSPAAEDLARRTDALSNRGFQSLKFDPGRS